MTLVVRPNDSGGDAIRSAREHYDGFLARHYSWMSGGHAKAVARQQDILTKLGLRPNGSGRALDLGCGSGFQTLALAYMGFQVTAVDNSRALLAELARHCGQFPVTLVEGDICDAAALVPSGFSAAVCMGDTLTHLPSRESVIQLFADLSRLLTKDGDLILSFRDLTNAPNGSQRSISVRSDPDRVATCVLEYEANFVVVRDLIRVRRGNDWQSHGSSYRKLRLSHEWVVAQLRSCGFHVRHSEKGDQMSLIAATLDEPLRHSTASHSAAMP